MIRAGEVIRWAVNISASIWLAYFLSGLWTDWRRSLEPAPPPAKARRAATPLGTYSIGPEASVELWHVRDTGLTCLMTVLTKSKQSGPRVDLSCAR